MTSLHWLLLVVIDFGTNLVPLRKRFMTGLLRVRLLMLTTALSKQIELNLCNMYHLPLHLIKDLELRLVPVAFLSALLMLNVLCDGTLLHCFCSVFSSWCCGVLNSGVLVRSCSFASNPFCGSCSCCSL